LRERRCGSDQTIPPLGSSHGEETRGGGAGRSARVESREQPKRWSQTVTRESNALDLEPGVFALADPRAIARSLKRD
jgi:hypothetical protein